MRTRLLFVTCRVIKVVCGNFKETCNICRTTKVAPCMLVFNYAKKCLLQSSQKIAEVFYCGHMHIQVVVKGIILSEYEVNVPLFLHEKLYIEANRAITLTVHFKRVMYIVAIFIIRPKTLGPQVTSLGRFHCISYVGIWWM